MNQRVGQKAIPKRREMNKISPTIASAYFLEAVSNVQHKERELTEIPEDSLSWKKKKRLYFGEVKAAKMYGAEN